MWINEFNEAEKYAAEKAVNGHIPRLQMRIEECTFTGRSHEGN